MAIIELNEKDMDLVLEALQACHVILSYDLDIYTSASKVDEPDFVRFMEFKINRLDELYEQIFAERYKIDGI